MVFVDHTERGTPLHRNKQCSLSAAIAMISRRKRNQPAEATSTRRDVQCPQNLIDSYTTEGPGRYPSRAVIGALVLVVCCLFSTARLIIQAPAPSRLRTSDPFTLGSDQRFAQLKAVLPARGVVGYVDTRGSADVANYYLAQYALAPLVVDYSPQHALVVGNFPANSSARDLSPNLHLIRDFGNGVLLFANKDVR
jgi:hypothetical protein